MDNTLELLIVAISLGLILGGGGYAIYTYLNDNEQENAQRLIDSIAGKYEVLKDEEKNTFIFQGFRGANKWFLLGWSKVDPSRPEKCSFESCLCICKGLTSGDCQKNGICRFFGNDSISIKNDVKGFVVEEGYSLFVQPSCIPLSTKTFSLELSRDGTLFSIHSGLRACVSARG